MIWNIKNNNSYILKFVYILNLIKNPYEFIILTKWFILHLMLN